MNKYEVKPWDFGYRIISKVSNQILSLDGATVFESEHELIKMYKKICRRYKVKYDLDNYYIEKVVIFSNVASITRSFSLIKNKTIEIDLK